MGIGEGRCLVLGISWLFVTLFIFSCLWVHQSVVGQDAAETYNLSVEEYHKGNLDAALKGFQDVLKVNPNDVEALIYIGNIQLKKKQYEEALSSFQKAVTLNPDPHNAALAWNNVGVVQQEGKQNLDEAIKAYQKAVGLKPDFHEAYSNLGNAFLAKEKFEDAVRAYERAIEIFSRKATEKISPEQAESAVQKALTTVPQDYDKAIQTFGKVALKRYDKPELHDNLGIAYQRLNDLSKCIFEYAQAVGLAPEVALYHTHLGLALLQNGKLADALFVLERAKKLGANVAAVHLALGIIYAEKGRAKEAEACLMEATRLEPQNWTARFRLGLLYDQQNQLEQAAREYAAAVAIKEDPVLCNNLGRIYYLQQKWDDAVTQFQKAISMNKEFVVAHKNLALACKALGDREKALEEWKVVLALEPGSTNALLEIADIRLEMKQIDEAVKLYRQVIAKDAKNVYAYVTMGFALYETGNFDGAEQAYKGALSIDSKNADALNGLGAITHRRGKLDEAIEYYIKALQANPNHETAKANLELARRQKETKKE